MKLLCILISFTLVNVLVADLDLYAEEVFKTNELIKDAKSFLPKIITNIVQADQRTYSLRDIANMLVVPESDADTFEQMSICQGWLQEEIKKVKVFDKPTTAYEGKSNGNTLSKFGTKRRKINGKAGKTISDGDFTDTILREFGEKRRDIIGKAVKFLTDGVLAGENQEFQAVLPMCNLIGLIKSIQNPKKFVVKATVQGINCILEDVSGSSITYQHDENNNYWEINKDGKLGPNLSNQLGF